MAFDNYVRKYGKASVGVTALGTLLALPSCGAEYGALLVVANALVAIFALGLPLLWYRLQKDRPPLEAEARRWAWFTLGAMIAFVPLIMLLEVGLSGSCHR